MSAPSANVEHPTAEARGVASPSAPSRQRHILVGLLFLHTFHTYLDRVCISAAATDIKADLAISDQMMGHIFAVFAIGYALFQIPAGWMADRFGARRALTWVVTAWSVFTCLTGAAYHAVTLLVVRFLFGVGEAGAFPGATRALYAWVPARERGLAQGFYQSGARAGAALSLLFLPWIISWLGWRWTFAVAGATGALWSVVWWVWFRDDPARHSRVNAAELALIRSDQPTAAVAAEGPRLWPILSSWNVLFAMFQYAASNVTFFISFTWLLPYLRDQWGEEAIALAPVPLVFGMLAQWFSGWLGSVWHRRGSPVASRRLPAVAGFIISAVGLVLCTRVSAESALAFVACFSVAVFGVEMTISPSWSFCMDIGGRHTGAVSGAMNMVGNLGSAASAMLFPWFVGHVTLPVFAETPGTANAFFIFAAGLNLVAAALWFGMNPQRASATGSKLRVAIFIALVALVVALVVGPKIF